MNIEILDLAELDILDGFHFYESQAAGLGSHFLDCIYSDIESLRLYAGIHLKPQKISTGFWRNDFRLRFTIPLQTRRLSFMPSLIAAAIRPGSGND